MTTVGEAWAEYYKPGMDPKIAQGFKAGWAAVIEACGGTDHLLEIKPSGDWTVQHPITERLDGTLFDCEWTGITGVLVFHRRFGDGDEALGRWRGFVDENGDRRWERPDDAS